MRAIRVSLIAALSAMVFTTTLGAQSGLGNISGRVTDPSGAAIVGATIGVVNDATQVRTQAIANASGIYQIFSLVPGTYTVEAVANNFKKFVRPNILVQVEDHINLDLSLQVGAATETVVVTAVQSQLRAADAQLGEVINNSMIETLGHGDPLTLLTLAGNVQGNGGRVSLGGNGPSITANQGDTRINGGRTGALEYLIDGVPATGGFIHQVTNNTPNVDAVQEIKVITNGMSAEYGRLSGGLVSVATKGGTDAFHGLLFEYNSNAFLDANSWNNDALCAADPEGNAGNCKKTNFRNNDYGGTIGGPVIIPHFYNGKHKTFFYFNYEGTRGSSAGNRTIGQTITDQERTGDLTDIGVGTANDPYARVWDPYGPVSATPELDPDSGNMLYKRLHLAGGDGRHVVVDPVAAQYLKLMPHPNRAPIAGSGTAGNYEAVQNNSGHSDSWAIRLDQSISDKQRIFGRFSHNNELDGNSPFYSTLATTSNNKQDNGFGLQLHYDYTINPTTILEVQTGGNYSPFTTGTFLPSNIKSADFGYGPALQSLLSPNDMVRVAQGPMTEGDSFGGFATQYSQGLNGTQGAFFNSTNVQYTAVLTKLLNRHTLKFGYEGRRYYDNFTQKGQSNNTAGISDGYSFDSEGVTQYIGNNGGEVWSPQGHSNGVGQFLMGIDSWIRVTQKLGRSLSSNYYASYLQDDFKVSPKLTLNLGLRWETETPVVERNNNLSVWNPNAPAPFTVNTGYSWNDQLVAAGLDPSQVATPDWVKNGFAPGALQLVKTPEHPSRNATLYHPWNFAPRLGLAYQLDNATVLRASLALMYLPTSGSASTYGDTPGVNYVTTLSNVSTQGPPGPNTGIAPTFTPRTLANPFDPSQLVTFAHSNALINAQAAASGNGIGAMSIFAHMPHEFDWSLGFERQLPNRWLLEVTYSANASNTLLTIGNPSRFPKALYTGGVTGANNKIYNTTIASPTAGQVADNSYTGQRQLLGILEYKYPYFGPTIVEGENIGTNNYQSANLRVQRRFANSFQLLFNYTYGKALDDTGGSDTGLGNPGQGSGTGGKAFQQVDASVHSVYGISPLDETSRISSFYNYQLPFGRGRRWGANPSGIGGDLAQAVAGGWEFSGNYNYRSGRPISLGFQGQTVNQGIYIRETFGSLAPGYTLGQLFKPHSHPMAPGGLPIPANASPALDLAALANGGTAQSFTYGNLPVVIGAIRNPGNWNSDLSAMKSFLFTRDTSRYFQLRLDAGNIFNHPGRGGYDTNVGDNTFGYITGPGNGPRGFTASGRITF